MLFKRRKELEEKHQRELSGEDLWTMKLDERTRMKIFYAVQKVRDDLFYRLDIFELARQRTLVELGLPYLYTSPPMTYFPTSDYPCKEVLGSIMESEEDIVFSLLEAILTQVLINKESSHWHILSNLLNSIFIESRIKVELINGKFVEKDSLVLHKNIIKPVLTLLGSDSKWLKVEKEYSRALEEIASGKPYNAVTNATTALQEALLACNLEGKTLKKLFYSAKKKKILHPQDENLIDWVSADRVNFGTTHYHKEPRMEDARLTLNIVGAIILRIASKYPRQSSETS